MIRGDAGTGTISSVVGVTAFLSLLLFAVQLVLNLYATSVVTAVAFDAARIVAGSDGDAAAEVEAERHVRDVLHGYGEGLRLTWAYRDTDGRPGPDVVALTVSADSPTRLVAAVPLPFQHISRTVIVRLESFR